MPEPFKVAHLDELERVPGPDTLTWLPVRAHFDLRAFGTNAYVAEAEGDDVVEPHTENPKFAHQELYFVARGVARFEIDGESFEAPSGTYVFVPDPASHRHAVAVEAGTTVLSFGGPPSFEPSAWESWFRALPLIGTEPDRAERILSDGLEAHPESAGIRFGMAELAASRGELAEALRLLAEAVERQAEVAELIRDSERFGDLKGDPEFERLAAADA
jgi:tetratricopeptide repeat protein/AraC-like protein